MRILLASAPHADTFGYSMPPPGLLRLGGELDRRGLDVALEDLAFRLASGALPPGEGLAAAAAELLLARSPDVVGLSVMGATLPIALCIAEELRARRPDLPVGLGGPGAGGIDVALLERAPALDWIVRGEAEETLVELLARTAAGRDLAGVAGVTWRAPAGIAREPDRAPLRDLAALAPYAWHLLPPLTDYKAITGEEEGLTPLDSGRGCVFDCSFCSIGRYWSRRSRPLPAASLVDEVLALRTLPGARRAYLCHDLFGADREHAVAFCRGLIDAGAPVPWEARARADHLDPELLALMRRAGGYRVLLGVESADPRVRRANQKGMRDDVDLLGVVDACTAAGITPILSLLLGLPGEDERALAASLDFCADAALRAGVNLSLHLPNPQPGCALGEEHGAEARPVDGVPPDMAWGAGETAAERAWIDAHPDLFGTFALLPDDADRWRALATLARELPEALMRYPRTFALLRRRRGEDALALWRAWQATGRSFEGFARDLRDPRIEDCLRWEEAQVRAGARALPPLLAPAPQRVPRAAGEPLVAHHDLAHLTQSLRDGVEPPAAGRAHAYLVQRVDGDLAGVRTLRVSDDVARVLGVLRTAPPRPLADWERERPGIADVFTRLADAGLVAFSPEAPPSSAQPTTAHP